MSAAAESSAIAKHAASGAEALLEDIAQIALFGAAQLFAPQSLILSEDVKWSSSGGDAANSAPAEIQPGDIILVSSKGTVFSAFRRFTGCEYDHVGLVVAPGVVLHVGPPRTRLLPLRTIFSRRHKVVVLRPQLPPAALQAMCAASVQLVGEKYASLRAVGALSRLVIDHSLDGDGLAPMAPSLAAGTGELSWPAQRRELHLGRWLCSDAIMAAMCQHSPAFQSALHRRRRRLRLHRIGVMVPDDFLVLHTLEPALFTLVPYSHSCGGGIRPAAAPQRQRPASSTQRTAMHVLNKSLDLLKMPGALVAVGVSSLPQAVVRSISVLLYALSLGALSKVLWSRLVGSPWPLRNIALLQFVQKTASTGAAAVLLHGLAVWLQEALQLAPHGGPRQQAHPFTQQRALAELLAAGQHVAVL